MFKKTCIIINMHVIPILSSLPGAGAAIVARYLHYVSIGFHHSRSHRAHSRLRDQFHAHFGPGVDSLQVENELGQVW